MVAWLGGGLGSPTCLTLTITKLSTSGYFSSARCVRPDSPLVHWSESSTAHHRIGNSSATSWRLLLTRCWVGLIGCKDAAEGGFAARFRQNISRGVEIWTLKCAVLGSATMVSCSGVEDSESRGGRLRSLCRGVKAATVPLSHLKVGLIFGQGQPGQLLEGPSNNGHP